MRDAPTGHTGHGAALLLPALRGRTPSGVSLFAPGDWRKDLGLDPVTQPEVDDQTPVALDPFSLRTRRALHILARSQNDLPTDRITAALEPDADTLTRLRNALNNLAERGLVVNTGACGTSGQWRATPRGRASARADMRRGITPRDAMAAVRALTGRVQPSAMARWWPVADDRQLSPPATVPTVMTFLFATDHPLAMAPDLFTRIESALETLVQDGTLIAFAAARGKHLTRCYWPATPEETP